METIDILWVLTCTALLLLMQSGFACLEFGQVRSINSVNTALKNVIDLTLVAIIYWAVGYGLMFGHTSPTLAFIEPFAGTYKFFYNPSSDLSETTIFLYQLMFCSTGVTIISGAVAERIKLSGYLLISALMASILYPLFGRWVWATNSQGESIGWLGQLGFFDFAGSTVVHSVGGWVALASVIIIGPRMGRFNKDGKSNPMPGSNIAISTLGVILLWIGWFGFNGGSELALTERVPQILANTVLAASAGGLATCIYTWSTEGNPDVIVIINGILGGLVSITASCVAVTIPAALFIGIIGGLITIWITKLLEKYQIDDVVGAIPVHLGAGIWGTLAVALFADPLIIGSGLGRMDQLGIQAFGILVCGLYIFGFSFFILKSIHVWWPLRVSPEIESMGLDMGIHNIRSAVHELLSEIDEQTVNGRPKAFLNVPEGSELSSVAKSYNKMLTLFNTELERTLQKQAELEAQSYKDPLTNIDNRRSLDQQYETCWKTSIRRKEPLSCIMGDIDYFKAFNDTYGHQKGDECLIAVAHAIKAVLSRPDDFVARCGGEEFIILLPNTSPQGARTVAEEIRNSISTLEIPHGGSDTSNYVSISLGVTTFDPANDMTKAELLHQADNALYGAKNSGRNRVISYSEGPRY